MTLFEYALSNKLHAGPPPNFAARDQSDRYVPGTRPTLITNATIWTGASGGKQVVRGGEIYIDKGIVKYVGERVPESFVNSRDHHVLRINAGLLWVTPAINDLHSHLGVDSVPELSGSADTNSFNGIAQPWYVYLGILGLMFALLTL